MATLTVYSDAADGQIESSNAAYSSARSGSNLVATETPGGNIATFGQMFSVSTYYCWEMFISFDTSALGNSATITAAELSLYLFTNDTGGSSFTAQARLLDWGASLTTADWVAGGSISQTLLGTISTSSIGTGYFSFTENSTLFRDNIVKTGTTRMFCVSSRHVGNNTPTGRERLQVYDSGAAGTSQDPKLTITYTLPAGPSIRRAPLRIWRRAA